VGQVRWAFGLRFSIQGMSHVGIRIFSEDDELHALDGSFANSIGYQLDTGR
jgi:hypothetical protein